MKRLCDIQDGLNASAHPVATQSERARSPQNPALQAVRCRLRTYAEILQSEKVGNTPKLDYWMGVDECNDDNDHRDA